MDAFSAWLGDKFLCTFETRLQMFSAPLWMADVGNGIVLCFSPCVF